MFEKEIDEIYELCKRVVNEVPAVSVEFSYSIYGMRVCGLKRKERCLPSKRRVQVGFVPKRIFQPIL